MSCLWCCILPPAFLCSVLPIHALEVFANVIAAATPPHPFITVGQLCLGCSGLGSAGGGPPGRCACYMSSIVSVPCFCHAGLYRFKLILPACFTALLRTFPGSVFTLSRGLLCLVATCLGYLTCRGHCMYACISPAAQLCAPLLGMVRVWAFTSPSPYRLAGGYGSVRDTSAAAACYTAAALPHASPHGVHTTGVYI